METKEEKEERKKKKHNKRIIKDKIIRNMKTIFEQEKDYYKPGREAIFGIIIILNVKVMLIKIETYNLMNIVMKLKLT